MRSSVLQDVQLKGEPAPSEDGSAVTFTYWAVPAHHRAVMRSRGVHTVMPQISVDRFSGSFPRLFVSDQQGMQSRGLGREGAAAERWRFNSAHDWLPCLAALDSKGKGKPMVASLGKPFSNQSIQSPLLITCNPIGALCIMVITW